MIALWSGVGSQTSRTALQISTAKGISVPVKLSGEYSKKNSVSGIAAASSLICFAPATARSMVSCMELPKTTSLCRVEVELYRCTIAFFAPFNASKVLWMMWGLLCVSTCTVTSSGIRLLSIRHLANSNSVSLAAGKPISISLNPVSTRNWKNFSFSGRFMGISKDWLPSLMSTLHHTGAFVMVLLGHLRLGMSIVG